MTSFLPLIKRNAIYPKLLCLVSLALFGSLLTATNSSAFFGPKAGEPCKNISETRKISGKPFICERGKFNNPRWIPNPPISNADKGLALAFAGCVQGQLEEKSIYWYPRLYIGAIISYGYATNELKYNRLWELDIYYTDYITQTFSSASTLSSKWKELARMWNMGVSNSLNTWKQGGINAVDAVNASKTYDIQIEGICKVALSQVTAKAEANQRTVGQWVLRAAKELLPRGFGQ
jgi:hypothetical protein